MADNKMNTYTHARLSSSRRLGLFCLAAVISLVATASPSSLQAAAPSPALPDMMDKATVKAIDRGINYLVKTQRSGVGSWGAGGGSGNYPSVMTSLAGMALLANGSTAETGPYATNVTKAMNYILRISESHEDGLIVGPGGEGRSMYGHGFATLFLSQCYGMSVNKTNEKRIRKALDKAVRVIVKSQSDLGAALKHAGGWIYTPSGKGDEGSVTVTQFQALRGCRNVGIKVPERTIQRAVLYLKHTQNADGGISYSARSRGGSKPAISAAAIACFHAAGIYERAAAGEDVEAKMVKSLVAYVQKNSSVNSSSGHYFYTQFYMAQAMYQRGGKDWKVYYPQIRKKLLGIQNSDGSWNGDNVGTTYGTALATIILQLPYGYLPIFER